jgi:uncharacterized membrane protein YedE/YeeE
VSGAVRTALVGSSGGLSRALALWLLAGVVIGGALAARTAAASTALDARFVGLFGDGGLAALVLLTGGVLVGAGTRLAGGCTSGHGLSGCARAQPGSLAATATFFGVAIVLAFILQTVLP